MKKTDLTTWHHIAWQDLDGNVHREGTLSFGCPNCSSSLHTDTDFIFDNLHITKCANCHVIRISFGTKIDVA